MALRFILDGDALIITNAVGFGEAPWEPSTEGLEPRMEMCLGDHGGATANGSWICDAVRPVNVTAQTVIRRSVVESWWLR